MLLSWRAAPKSVRGFDEVQDHFCNLGRGKAVEATVCCFPMLSNCLDLLLDMLPTSTSGSLGKSLNLGSQVGCARFLGRDPESRRV